MVVALNGLAAIATIQNDFSLAAILYNEALTFAEEHSEDFRVDPLLNIHIHHNLAEILPLAANVALILPSKRKQFSGTSAVKATRKHLIVKVDHGPVKRHKTNGRNDINLTVASEEPSNDASNLSEDDLDDQEFANLSASSIKALIAECEDSKQKYLSLFSSKLSAAQLEFQNSYMQVNILNGSQGKFIYLLVLNFDIFLDLNIFFVSANITSFTFSPCKKKNCFSILAMSKVFDFSPYR